MLHVPFRSAVVECLTRDQGFEPHRRLCVVVLEQDTFILAKYWSNPGRPVPVELKDCWWEVKNKIKQIMSHLTIFSSPEPKARGWANSIPVTPASVCHLSVRQHFQTSSPLKPLGQLNSNFIWRLLRTLERKFVQIVLVTWPRLPPRPYMVKTL